MTPEQIKNWRDVLATTEIGLYAHIMPVEQIEKLQVRFQEIFNKMTSPRKERHE